MKVSRVVGVGSALPRRVVGNAELAVRWDLSAAEIERKTGVQQRYWVGEGETCATLATAAARAALASAGMTATDIGLIVVSTTSADYHFPSTACLVRHALGARGAAAFDVGASCAGFLYALSVADPFIQNGTVKAALVIASEVKSVFLDRDDPSTAMLFGDGAGAVVLTARGRGERGGIRSIRVHADGTRHRLVTLPAGGSRRPATAETLRAGEHTMKMDGPPLFRAAVRTMSQLVAETIATHAPIDLFLFHQANRRVLDAVMKRHPVKSHLTIQKLGNPSSASLAMTLADAVECGRVKAGDRIALCAFGGGVTWGAAVMDW